MSTKQNPPLPNAPKDNPAPDGQAEGKTKAKAGVKLRVSTRLPRHVRAGIEFRQGETEVEVAPKQAERLKADPHLKVEPA